MKENVLNEPFMYNITARLLFFKHNVMEFMLCLINNLK